MSGEEGHDVGTRTRTNDGDEEDGEMVVKLMVGEGGRGEC